MAEEILPPTLAAMLRAGLLGPNAPIPQTLSGMEYPEPPLPPAPHRALGRIVAQTGGGIAGGVGGGLVGGVPGAIAGGGLGSAGAGQGYDAAADWFMGTQDRPPVMSGDTARDFAAGAIPGAGPIVGAGMRAAGRGAAELASAAASRPTMASMLASGALGGAALTATPGGTQAPVEIPQRFQPMDQDEYFRRNRKASKSLADLQSEAEQRAMKAPGYEDLSPGQQRRKIEDARKSAKTLYDQQQGELAGEDKRLEDAYARYKAGLKTDLDAYFSGKAAEEQAARSRIANTPFRERYPPVAEALPYVGMGLAAGVPFIGGAMGNRAERIVADRLGNATDRAVNATSMRDFNTAADEIRNQLKSRPQSMLDQPTLGASAAVGARNMSPYVLGGAAGGALAAEGAMFPDQWDWRNLPPGPARDQAKADALNPVTFAERGLIGTGVGMSGYKAAKMMLPRTQPNWARAEAAANNPPGGGGGGGGGGGNLPSLIERRARPNPDDPGGHWIPPSPPGTPPAAGEAWVSPAGRNGVRWNDQLQRWQDDSGAIRSGPGRNYRRISSADETAPNGSMAEFLRG